MAQAPTTGEAPKKRKSFTRTEKPLYALVTYTDADGNAVKLDKTRLVIAVERDMDKIVEAMENGTGVATLMKLVIPKAATAKTAEAPAA